MTDKTYGYLTALKCVGRDRWGAALWECVCSRDGNHVVVIGASLRDGKTRSCGCLRDFKGERNPRYKHGNAMVGKYTPEYRAWVAMKDRCYNPNTECYPEWGGRGIRVCDRWLGSDGFQNFLADVGHKPTNKHSIDRWPNNATGNYEPGNVRWATWKEQANNRRPHRKHKKKVPASPTI